MLISNRDKNTATRKFYCRASFVSSKKFVESHHVLMLLKYYKMFSWIGIKFVPLFNVDMETIMFSNIHKQTSRDHKAWKAVNCISVYDVS